MSDGKSSVIKSAFSELKEFAGYSHEEMLRIYQNTLLLVLAQAMDDLFPQEQVRVIYSINDFFYAEMIDSIVSPREVDAIELRMKQIVLQDRVIRQRIEDADTKTDSGNAASPVFRLAGCGDVEAGFIGQLLPRTGWLKLFKLYYYQPGFVVQFPQRIDHDALPQFIPPVKLNRTMDERRAWLNNLKITDVNAINRTIADGSVTDLIYLAEALHEKKIAGIADLIANTLPKRRLVFIAGPSSSGKTTFVQRLSTQLRVNGLRPVTISLDDYYLPLEQCPKNAAGEYDFETIRALNVELFNEQVAQLLAGEEVQLPLLDFRSPERNKLGARVKIGQDDILLIEGIHGLNPDLLLPGKVPTDCIFRIYIAAMAQLNINDYNLIHSSDIRLIRRIVRDNKFRATEAAKVLERWRDVRRGEADNIAPYQEQADVMFDSSLIYELNALRPLADPLLQAVPGDSPFKRRAEQLLAMLAFFTPLRDDFIPFNSVLREFVGGSYLPQ